MNKNDLKEKLHKTLLKENSYSISETEANKYFDEFNTKYFNNKLEKIPVIITAPEENDKLNLNDIGKTIANIYYTYRSIVTEEILLNKNKIYSFEEFRDALVHEMIHYYVNVYYPPKPSNWVNVQNQYTEEELKNPKNLISIFTTLEIIDNQNHEGHWNDMANKLNDDFTELNIIDSKKQVSPEYIKNYISKHTIYTINDKLFVLKNGSDHYNNMKTLIDNGTTKIDWCAGNLYELVFEPSQIEGFDFFMVYKNHLKENIYNVKLKDIDYYEKEGYFKKNFIKTIKLDLTESNTKYKNWEDVPIELLKELDEIWKNIPIS